MLFKLWPQKDSFLERKKNVFVYFVSFAFSSEHHSLQITFIAGLSGEPFSVDFMGRAEVGHNLSWARKTTEDVLTACGLNLTPETVFSNSLGCWCSGGHLKRVSRSCACCWEGRWGYEWMLGVGCVTQKYGCIDILFVCFWPWDVAKNKRASWVCGGWPSSI